MVCSYLERQGGGYDINGGGSEPDFRGSIDCHFESTCNGAVERTSRDDCNVRNGLT